MKLKGRRVIGWKTSWYVTVDHTDSVSQTTDAATVSTYLRSNRSDMRPALDRVRRCTPLMESCRHICPLLLIIGREGHGPYFTTTSSHFAWAYGTPPALFAPSALQGDLGLPHLRLHHPWRRQQTAWMPRESAWPHIVRNRRPSRSSSRSRCLHGTSKLGRWAYRYTPSELRRFRGVASR